MLPVALIVYVGGVVVGLLRVDASPVTRLVVSLLWPLGMVAGVVTVSALVLAAMVLFPVLGVAVAVAGFVGWWLVLVGRSETPGVPCHRPTIKVGPAATVGN